MRDERDERDERVEATPVITPSTEWLSRRAEQLRNVKIVVGVGEKKKGKEMESEMESVREGRETSVSRVEVKMIADGWEFEF